jgi:alkylated DNA repair protein (DNA oxidative demethylase)
MARAPAEEPQGLLYSPDVISAAEENDLLRELQSLRWDLIVLHGRTARRNGRHFGFDYDYQARAPHPGDRVPDWLRPARERAGRLAGHEPEELVEIFLQQYPPGSTIGWHADAPAFGTVVGISLQGSSRLRFQRGKGARRRVWEVLLEPRSGYVLAGEVHTLWQHSITPTKELRYSITFRTLR